MLKLLKENSALAVGISLPLLVVLLFLLATQAPRLWVNPPQYDLLFTAGNDNYNNRLPITIRFQVVENKLRARVYKNAANQYSVIPKLFLFEHDTLSVREIAVELPGDLENIADASELPIADVRAFTINNSRRAPDGYEFIGNSYRRGGLVTGLFYGRRYRNRNIIAKQGRNIAIPPIQSNDYSNFGFLGWVVSR